MAITTLRFKVWTHLKQQPRSPTALAEIMRMSPDQMRDVYRRLRDAGFITFVRREGREAIYRVTNPDLPPGNTQLGRSPLIRPPKGASAPRAAPRDHGNGSGVIELERCWPGVRADQ